MIGEKVRLRNRAFKATVTLVVNAIAWIVIPSYISSLIAGTLPSIPLANLQFIYTFGAIITGLEVIGALTDGSAVSVPFVSGGYVATAFYIWLAVDGGVLSLSASGIDLTLVFKTLVFLMIIPALFNAIKAPLSFLLERSEIARPARPAP